MVLVPEPKQSLVFHQSFHFRSHGDNRRQEIDRAFSRALTADRISGGSRHPTSRKVAKHLESPF